MMRAEDLIQLASKSIFANRLRTSLMILAMAIGVASVILLAALGDSARRYVTGEFSMLGTNLIIVLPGRSETTGGPPPLMGETPRDLTTDDALSLLRSPYINNVSPILVGAAPVSWGGLEREVSVIGTTAAMKTMRHLELTQGRFLPDIDPRQASPVCVLGSELKSELFGSQSALGEWVRIGDRRFRVVGVLADSGVSIGVDFDDLVLIPVASAQVLFDSPSLFRIITEARGVSLMEKAANDIRRIIQDRHEGEDDVTVITQDSVIDTFDRILNSLTYAVSGIAAISLAVAGILTMNIMLVAVSQRTREIGLLKALGAPASEIRSLFIIEAILLSLFGALAGLFLGLTLTQLLGDLYPVLPISAPFWAVLSALGLAVMTGLIFGVIPAARASRLDPVSALSKR